MSKKEDVEYFKNIDLEKIYGKFFAVIEEKKKQKVKKKIKKNEKNIF